MFNKLTFAALSSALVGQVLGHGLMTSPVIRTPGTAFQTNCGQQLYYNVAADPAGNIQALKSLKSTDFNADKCNLNLCKGLQFADVPAANIQSWTPGQVVPITYDIRAPHTGTANVSIVDTASNTMISSTLIDFTVYASTSTPISANETKFSVTLPTDLGDKCATAGACVLQFWWDSREVDQTYESCVDFTMSGSGSGSSTPVATTSASSSAAAATTEASSSAAAAASTSAAVPATSTAAAQTSAAAATTKASSSAAAPTTTTQAAAAATTEAASGCGNLKARQFPVNAKWARCGGIGWSTTTCPEGLVCYAYNAYYSACIEPIDA